MDWNKLIADLRIRKMTLQQIATYAGMSKGQVHDLTTHKKKTVLYDTGVKLVALHKRVMRRKQQ